MWQEMHDLYSAFTFTVIHVYYNILKCIFTGELATKHTHKNNFFQQGITKQENIVININLLHWMCTFL